MSAYYPHNWVVIKIVAPTETLYKVLAGWSGDYLTGSSWKLNSGITRVEDDGDAWLFHGHSGSVYRCTKHSYELRANNAGIWSQIKDRLGDKVELLDENTNWLTLIT